MENKKPKNNLVIIGIGFVMILIVSVLIFYKTYFFKSRNVSLQQVEEIETENPDVKNYSSINSTDLIEKINLGGNFEIIDIRESSDFEFNHIKDSRNIPISLLSSIIDSFNKETEYILVDDFGFTPSEIEALDMFKQKGFTKFSYLEGGMSAWENEYNSSVSFGDPTSFIDQAKVTFIKDEELKKMIDLEASYLYIIDLRDNSQFILGHLKNAVNIPLETLEEKASEIPAGKKIILYSNDNLLSFQGAVRLFDLGMFNVFSLTDGLNNWKQKGFEIVD